MERKNMIELIKDGSIECQFKGNGNPTGDIGEIVLTNKTDKDIEALIPRGILLVPKDKKFQSMTTGRDIVVPLRGGETRSEEIEDGFCNDEYTKPPPNASTEGGTTFMPDPTGRVTHIVDNVERNLENGRYNATRLMKKEKARQTLIQWTLWRTANPRAFDKDTAKRIIVGQYKDKEQRPKDEAIDQGVDMLFDDIELTIKETPSTTPVTPAATSSRRPCDCQGSNDPGQHASPPDVKISEHYLNESDRTEIRRTIERDILESSARVTPATVCAFSNEGAAVGGYGDARAAYLFIRRLGSYYGSKYLNRTERLRAEANGYNTDTITVRHREEEGCEYEKVVGAAAIAILGSGAIIYDPLQGTEGGFRVLENLYEAASEFIEQEWITKVFDAIRDATTKYYVNIRSNANIDVSVGRNRGHARVNVNALLDRDGSELNSPPEDMAGHDSSFAIVSDCVKGDSLSLRLDGDTALQIEANDGGLGIVGQESLIGYVWYWACKTTRDGEETVDARWGHDWRFTVFSEDMADARISLRETLTQNTISGIMDATIGAAAHEDPFDCGGIRSGMEEALKRW
ncbi:MAG: hypothetical protein JW825_04890, partial [Candidatus Methanofastidiosa archaeon]|nr:hypothetical protein [Candidatus Methanofastidiosa archaeon]